VGWAAWPTLRKTRQTAGIGCKDAAVGGKNNNPAPQAPSWAIAAGAFFSYNLQPNQSSSQRFLGASAFIWLGIQKDGQMPIFFW
jgi:hypothetical protein